MGTTAKLLKGYWPHMAVALLVLIGGAAALVYGGAPSEGWALTWILLLMGWAAGWSAWLRNQWLLLSGKLQMRTCIRNWHYDDIAEESSKLTMKNGEPITDLVKWWAAREQCSRPLAEWVLDRITNPAHKQVVAEHATYLRGFKTY